MNYSELLMHMRDYRDQEPMTGYEIADRLKVSVNIVHRLIGMGVRKGHIESFKAPGANRKRYRYKASPHDEDNSFPISITTSQIRTLISRWAETGWHPKIFESYKALPKALHSLTHLSYNTLNKPGFRMTEQDLQAVHDELGKFITDLNAALLITRRIQNLCKRKDVMSFFMTGNDDQLLADANRMLEWLDPPQDS